MSQNVQLAQVLLPPQAAPKSSPRAQKEIAYSADVENDSTAMRSDESAGARNSASPRKNAFDRVLNKRMEKDPAAETDSSTSEQLTQGTDAETAALVWEQLFAPTAAMTGAAPQADTAQSLSTVPQTAETAANGSVLTQAPAQAASSPATDAAIPQAEAEQGQDAFDTLLNQKQKGDGLTTATKPAGPQSSSNAAPGGLETAAAKTGKELPMQPQAEKPVTDQMPTLPEQAVRNTAEKPAAVKSPVLAAQSTPMADTAPETEQAAAKLRAGLKTAYQAKPTVQPAQKQSSAFGQIDSAVSTHGAAQLQQKASDLNISESKVSGIENPAAAKIRAADAVTVSRPAEQIAQSLPAGPARADQQIRLTLTPPELGTVRITFREQEGEIIGVVEAQKAQTRKDIEESMPQLMSAMQNQGLQVRRIEVVQWNTPQQGTRDQLSENYNPSAEREFLQQGQTGSNERSSRNADSEQSGTFEAPSAKQSIGDTNSPQWFSDKGLNLYI